MTRIFIFLSLIIFTQHLYSQCNGRYSSEIFSSVNVTEVEYTDVYDLNIFNTGLDMDVYVPDGDTEQNRPVIIFAHGGTFIAGTKTDAPIVELCEAFAKRGYVTASIQYRLTSPLFLTDSLHMVETVLESVSDAKAAIRYFRKDYSLNNNFGIDPDQIYIGGYSAGAVIANHIGYFNDLSVAPNYISSVVNSSLIGGLDGNSGNSGFSSDVKGVINIAGALTSTVHMDINDVPIVSVQATDDATLPYYCDHALQASYMLTCCGAGSMHDVANNLGLYNALYTFQGGGHSMPVSQMANITVPFISDFIFTTLDCYQSTNNLVNHHNKINVYPNPSLNFVNISSKDLISKVQVFDLMGRAIYSKDFEKFNVLIDLESAVNGIYNLVLHTEKGLSTHILIKK